MKYRLHPAAALEHVEQISYYEERRLGLGARYHAAMLNAVARACASPAGYKVERAPDIRKVALRGFKFFVIYREVRGEVQVLAIRIIAAIRRTGPKKGLCGRRDSRLDPPVRSAVSAWSRAWPGPTRSAEGASRRSTSFTGPPA